MSIETLQRIFSYNNLRLEDPDPSMTPEKVKEFYAGIYPELTQSIIEEPQVSENAVTYKLAKTYGTKGAETLEDTDDDTPASFSDMETFCNIMFTHDTRYEAFPSGVLEAI